MAEQLEFDQAHQTLQEVSEALENGRFVHVRRQLQDMEPEDIAHLLEASPRKSRDVLWQLTDPEDYGEILDELNEDVKDALVSKMAQRPSQKQPKAWRPMMSPTYFEACQMTFLVKFYHRWTQQTEPWLRMPFLTQRTLQVH